MAPANYPTSAWYPLSLNKGGPRGVTYPQTVLDLNHEAIAALGEQYIERTLRHRDGAAHFTDKMPNNFSPYWPYSINTAQCENNRCP